MPERRPSSSLAKIALIAWREFRHTALTKGFILGAVVAPVVLLALTSLIPLLVSRETPPLVGRIAVADPTGTLAARIDAALREPPPVLEAARELAEDAQESPARALAAARALPTPTRIEVQFVPLDAASTEDLRGELLSGRYLAAISVQPSTLDPTKDVGGFSLLVPSSLPPKHVFMISGAAQRAVEAERIARSGIDPVLVGRLARAPAPDTTRVSPDGASSAERTEFRMVIPVAFMMLIFIAVFTSANYLLTTTIEEKSNKVIEVLLAAVSPMELLCGKIAGCALVSLVILVMYGGLGVAGLLALAMFDVVPLAHLAYLVIYFVMAYAMLAAMMAAVGSAVSDLHEAQSLLTPVMGVVMTTLVLSTIVLENPNGTLATVASFIPPATPFIMIVRLTASPEHVPFWQTAASIAWGFACAWGMLWMAARIFRIGVLMQGKAPTPRELMRWALVR